MISSRLKNKFKFYYFKKPQYYFDVGGRFEICGNHTDHNHGLCVVANADLRIKCACRKNNIVRVKSKNNQWFDFTLDELSFNENEKHTTKAICKGVLFKLKEEGYKIGGFDCYIESQLPNGAGISSSAAIESLFCFIESYLYNNGKIPNITIAKIGQYSENNYFVKPCGLLDQIGTSFDSVNYIDFKNINSPIIKTIKFDLPLTIYLIKSFGNHSNLTNLYANIPASMKRVAEALDKKEFLRDCNKEDIYNRIDNLKLSDAVKRKAKHFFIENKNVKECVKAIEEKDVNKFLKVINSSQESSYKNLENTFVKGEYENSPQNIIDDVSKFLKDNGAIRIHGGGFKGTVICFVKNEFQDEFDKYLKLHYKNKDYFKTKISAKAVNFEKL